MATRPRTKGGAQAHSTLGGLLAVLVAAIIGSAPLIALMTMGG